MVLLKRQQPTKTVTRVLIFVCVSECVYVGYSYFLAPEISVQNYIE